MSVNSVCLVGRLTRDPEARTTTSGKTVVTFSLAVTKRFKPQDGGPDADFFRVTAWGNAAEFVKNYLGKGRLVAVTGRLQSRKYTTQDGDNREVVEVVADTVDGLERPRDEPAGAGTVQATAEEEYDPFAE